MKKVRTLEGVKLNLIAKQDFRVTSLELAEWMGGRHSSVMLSIQNEINKRNPLFVKVDKEVPRHHGTPQNFNGRTSAPIKNNDDSSLFKDNFNEHIILLIKKIEYIDKRNRKKPLILLTEYQATVIFFKNHKSKNARILQGEYFRKMEALKDIYRKEKDWRDAREKLRKSTRDKTDLIKSNYEYEHKETCPREVYIEFENLQMEATIGWTATEVINYLHMDYEISKKDICARDYLLAEYVKKSERIQTTITTLLELGDSYKQVRNKLVRNKSRLPIGHYIDMSKVNQAKFKIAK